MPFGSRSVFWYGIQTALPGLVGLRRKCALLLPTLLVNPLQILFLELFVLGFLVEPIAEIINFLGVNCRVEFWAFTIELVLL